MCTVLPFIFRITDIFTPRPTDTDLWRLPDSPFAQRGAGVSWGVRGKGVEACVEVQGMAWLGLDYASFY